MDRLIYTPIFIAYGIVLKFGSTLFKSSDSKDRLIALAAIYFVIVGQIWPLPSEVRGIIAENVTGQMSYRQNKANVPSTDCPS